MKLLKSRDFYQTSDLSLATTISLYFPVEAVDRQNPQKASFLFKRVKELDELIENYWRGQLQVEPQTLFNQLRQIKSRIYAE